MFSLIFDLLVIYMIVCGFMKIDGFKEFVTQYIPEVVFTPGVKSIDWVWSKLKELKQ